MQYLRVTKGNDSNVDKTISLNENISAPISKGDVIGNVTFSLNGETISNVNLIADSDVEKFNLFSMGKKVLGNWFYLFRNSK